ncbi:MAG: aminotransferase class I/II-fold pyridoxal phosphate-dependent enzyme [Bryobacterales bacterium]|nr:aminotransferase class I/II-fold pyridoxal phosphate-dependent enzyme [Bryobacterales bacterium]
MVCLPGGVGEGDVGVGGVGEGTACSGEGGVGEGAACTGEGALGSGEGAFGAGEGAAGAGEARRILLSPPDVGRGERAALLAAFDSNWISTVGPAITRFEEQMAAKLGRPCVALSSGTAAIHLALRLAGVEAGDTVICQSFTFVATANPILYERAIPYFVDSEPRTWNLDADLVEEAIRRLERKGRRPRAVMAVHLYGVPAEIERIASVCARYEVPLIEDAAEALGARVSGRPVGVHGQAAAFSFNGNKIITTAGGGMLAVRNEAEAARVRKWSTQSREAVAHYEHTELGFNYRMSNLLAALGCAQLEGLEAKAERRRAIAERYREELGGPGTLAFQREPEQCRATHWLTCALVHAEGQAGDRRRECRDALIAHLARQGIESRRLWKPMHQQPLFRDAPRLGGTVSESLFAQGICLPSSSALTESEQGMVIDGIRGYFGQRSLDSLARFTRPAIPPRVPDRKKQPT